MQGVSNTNSTPNRIIRSAGRNWTNVTASRGMAMKLTISKIVKNRTCKKDCLKSIRGICKKVTNSIKPNAGVIAPSRIVVPGKKKGNCDRYKNRGKINNNLSSL